MSRYTGSCAAVGGPLPTRLPGTRLQAIALNSATRFVLEPHLLTHQPLRPPKKVKMNYWSMTQGAQHSIHIKHRRQRVTTGRSSVNNRMCSCLLPTASSHITFSSSTLLLPLAGSPSSARTGCPAYRTSPPHGSSPICRRNFTSFPAGIRSPLHCSATMATLRTVVSPARPPRFLS